MGAAGHWVAEPETVLYRSVLLANHTAGDACTGGTCRVRHVVVRSLMNHKGGTIFIEQGGIEPQLRIQNLDLQPAGGGNVDVGHVAGMHALRIHVAVLGGRRVEMAPCRLEGWLAQPDVMHMKPMGTFRQVLERGVQQRAVRSLVQYDLTNRLATGVHQRCTYLLRCTHRQRYNDQRCGNGNGNGKHNAGRQDCASN